LVREFRELCPDMSKMDLLVSVEDEYMDRLSEVAKGCEDAGMNVEQKLEEIGVLTGSIDSAEKVELLRKVEGVSHVEESRQIQIAPPDSPIQ
jgi:hypothetical protein